MSARAYLRWPFVPLAEKLTSRRIMAKRPKFLSLRYVRDLQIKCRKVFAE